MNFGSTNNRKTTTPKRTSRTSSKTTSRSTTSRSSSSRSTRRSRSRNNNPFQALFKGKNKKLYTYGSLIGGILILLIIGIFSFSSPAPKAKSPAKLLDKSAYLKQGNEFADKKEFEKAIKAYEKAYELDPHDSYATDQISVIYQREYHDEAMADYWKKKSYEITTNKVQSDHGASAKAYEEKAARKAQRQGKGR